MLLISPNFQGVTPSKDRDMAALDRQPSSSQVRERLFLQERLIEFILDENNWSELLPSEQSRLLQKLSTRDNSSNPFARPITFQSRDEKGHLIVRKANLLLDTSRNQHLGQIFDQAVDSAIGEVIETQLDRGLLDLMARLLHYQDGVQQIMRRQASATPLADDVLGLMEDVLPLSPEDLRFIQRNQIGIQVPLVPQCLRSPLNRIYEVICEKAPQFSSLAFQFHLQQRIGQQRQSEIWTLMLGFISKAFYAVARKQGLSADDLCAPEASWFDRLQYLTEGDESSSALLPGHESGEIGTGLEQVKRELVRLRRETAQIRQRYQVQGLSVTVDLTLEQILSDIFGDQRRQLQELAAGSEQEYQRLTLWLPTEVKPLAASELENFIQHAEWIAGKTEELSIEENSWLQQWTSLGQQEANDSRTQAQLASIGMSDPEAFPRVIQAYLAKQHQEILQQHIDQVITLACKQVTRLVLNGTLDARSLTRKRYAHFAEEILPYLYFYESVSSTGEIVWIPSPYPLSKLHYALDLIQAQLEGAIPPLQDAARLAKAQEMLDELLLILLEPEGNALESVA
jgi:hypothetical protein